MGLGTTHDVTLAEAREETRLWRKVLREGVDPLAARNAQRAQRRAERLGAMTFRQCAEAYVQAHAAGWKNPKHTAQWTATLETYVHPVFGDRPVKDIDTGLLLRALDPIWRTKTETASRLRGRVEAVLDWAAARKLRTGENPARWRGHLDKLLPARTKVRSVVHHPALAHGEVAVFMRQLRGCEFVAARALEFTILTAGRTGEVIGATWDEMDLEAAIWNVPAERMKSGRPHRVPLSRPALAVLEKMSGVRESDYIFTGARPGRGLSNMAMLKVMTRLGRDTLTVHGFRSTFRDWAAELTTHPNEVVEMALAHVIQGKAEAAYRRGDLLEKRRSLMEDWAAFCNHVI
jgi:integrase